MSITDFLTSVKVKNGYVYITGINANQLLTDINRHQGDRRFCNNVFEVTFRGLRFYEFFLPDVFYLVEELYNKTKSPPRRYRFSHILGLLKDNTWIGEIDQDMESIVDLSKLKNITYTLKPHQHEFLEYYGIVIPKLKLRGTLLAAAAGSGKTSNTLALGECLSAERIIVICPLPAVTRVWNDQIQEVFRQPQTYWLSTSNTRYTNQRIAVYHYEALGKAMEDVLQLKAKSGRTLVILDESHNLNNPKSLRTELFQQFVKQIGATDIVFASGTPVKAEGPELIVLFRVIDPNFTPEVEQVFKKVFSSSSKNNLSLLKARLGKVSFKVEKSAINLAAPNLIPLSVAIPNSDNYTLTVVAQKMREFVDERTIYYQKRAKEDLKFYNDCIAYYETTIRFDKAKRFELHQYKDAIEHIRRVSSRGNQLSVVKDLIEFSNRVEKQSIIPRLLPEDKAAFKEVKTLVKYPMLKVQGEALGRILGRLRVECHRDMAAHIDYSMILDEAEKKTVIFSSYIEVCDQVVSQVTQKGYQPATVYGPYTKNLSATVHDFMQDASVNPMVATYASLSTAVPLIVANTMVLINSPFRAYIQEQAISRVHRLGQDTAIFIYECTLDTGEEPNLSTRGIDILKWSQEQVEAITGMPSIFTPVDIVDEGDALTVSNESFDVMFEYRHSLEVVMDPIKHKLEEW